MNHDGANLAVLPGDAGRVRVIEAPLASPARGEVLVRMLHAPINPADLLAIDGRYSFDLSRDVPIGAEGVGVVEQVGEGVSAPVPGAIVLPLSRGNWCRYRTLPAHHLIVLPPHLDPRQAAMLRINPPTAWLLLRAAGAAAGDVIVQNAAGSAVARWVRLFAARQGIAVVDVVRRADPALPDAIVDGDDLPERVAAAVDGRPVRAALDCVAGTATERLARCLVAGGGVVVFGHLSGEPISLPSQLLTGGGLSITGFSLRPAEAALKGDGIRAMFAELSGVYAADPSELPIREIVPIDQAERAVALARSGGAGRVMLDLAQ